MPVSKQWEAASISPGRVRLRLVRPSGQDGALNVAAARIATLSNIRRVELLPDAGSLVVRFDAHRSVRDTLNGIEAALKSGSGNQGRGKLPTREGERVGKGDSRQPYILVEHACAGRLRLQIPAIGDRPDLFDSLRTHLLRRRGITHAYSSDPREGSVTVRYSSSTLTAEKAFAVIEREAGSVLARGDSGSELIRAKDLQPESPRGPRGMILPSLAIALAATEALPAAIAGAALAIAAVPVLRRAARGVRERQVTVDQFDLTNLGLLALQGEFLAAGGMAWLLALGEWIRGASVRRTRAAAKTGPARGDRILEAPASDTLLQEQTNQAGRAATPTLYGLGALLSLLRGDPSAFLGIVKPRYDLASAMRFGVPAPIVNALASISALGWKMSSARALESLATMRTLLVDESAGDLSDVAALEALGIHVQRLSGSVPARIARIRRHQAAGYVVAVAAGPKAGDWTGWADVRIWTALPSNPDSTADVVREVSASADLSDVIEMTREAMQIARQNTAAAAAASAWNLATATLDLSPAPLSTAVNTGALAVAAANSARQAASLAARRVPRLISAN